MCLFSFIPNHFNHQYFLSSHFFRNRELAHKILVTGKSINFLKDICDERTIIKGRKELKEYLETNGKTFPFKTHGSYIIFSF